LVVHDGYQLHERTTILEGIDELEALAFDVDRGACQLRRGLIAGNAVAAHAINPDLDVIGVCSVACPSMYAALTGETARCSARGATLDLMIETKDKAHASQAIGRLEAEGFQVSRLEGWSGRVSGTR
jgi:threonine dehydratase